MNRIVMLIVLSGTSLVYAQAPSAPASAPKLTEPVLQELNDARWSLAKNAVQVLQLQQEIDRDQKQLQQIGPEGSKLEAQFRKLLAEAIVKSGLDPEKWQVDPETLKPIAQVVKAQQAPQTPQPSQPKEAK